MPRWPPKLPSLTVARTIMDDETFKKRKTRVLSPWAWRNLQSCLIICADLLTAAAKRWPDKGASCRLPAQAWVKFLPITSAASHTSDFTGLLEVTLPSDSGVWPAARPSLDEIDGPLLASLIKAVLEYASQYCKACQRDAAMSPEREERYSRLEGLVMCLDQPEQTLANVRDAFDHSLFKLSSD